MIIQAIIVLIALILFWPAGLALALLFILMGMRKASKEPYKKSFRRRDDMESFKLNLFGKRKDK